MPKKYPGFDFERRYRTSMHQARDIHDTDIPTVRQLLVLEVLTVADCVWRGIPARRW